MFARNAAKGIWSGRRTWMRLIPAGKGYKCAVVLGEIPEPL
jgi:hypothetical protein